MARCKIALITVLVASQAAWADLTIQYQFDFKFGPAVPPAVAESVKAQMGGLLPAGMAMRVKGQQCMTSVGPVTTVVNGYTKEVTVMNSATRQFATVPAQYYTDQALSQIPPNAAQALQSFKIDVKASKTGQSKLIHGVLAEDNLLTISMDAPNPAGPSIAMRMELHSWFAAGGPDQFSALRQLDGCSTAAGNSDPRAVVDKLLGLIPGMKEKFGDSLKAFMDAKKGPALETNVGVFVPAMAALLPVQPGAPAVDPAAPMIQVNTNLAELSQDPIPDSAFAVPDGYQAAPIADLLKSATPRVAPAQLRAASAQSAAPELDYTGPIVRPGNGVAFSNPIPVSRLAPQYTEEARKAKIEGGVLLSVVIDPDGDPRNIKVVRSLDPGLDEKAMEAVRQWKFKPGMKDGSPVAIQAQIEVTFKLLDKAPGKQ